MIETSCLLSLHETPWADVAGTIRLSVADKVLWEIQVRKVFPKIETRKLFDDVIFFGVMTMIKQRSMSWLISRLVFVTWPFFRFFFKYASCVTISFQLDFCSSLPLDSATFFPCYLDLLGNGLQVLNASLALGWTPVIICMRTYTSIRMNYEGIVFFYTLSGIDIRTHYRIRFRRPPLCSDSAWWISQLQGHINLELYSHGKNEF